MPSSTKSATLTVRLQPATKDALRALAAREQRSLANMLEVMIGAYAAAGQPGSGERLVTPPRAAALPQ